MGEKPLELMKKQVSFEGWLSPAHQLLRTGAPTDKINTITSTLSARTPTIHEAAADNNYPVTTLHSCALDTLGALWHVCSCFRALVTAILKCRSPLLLVF